MAADAVKQRRRAAGAPRGSQQQLAASCLVSNNQCLQD